jgi:hypothetical protein
MFCRAEQRSAFECRPQGWRYICLAAPPKTTARWKGRKAVERAIFTASVKMALSVNIQGISIRYEGSFLHQLHGNYLPLILLVLGGMVGDARVPAFQIDARVQGALGSVIRGAIRNLEIAIAV